MLSCFADLGFTTTLGIHKVFEFIEMQSHANGEKPSSWHGKMFEDMGIIACVVRELDWFDVRYWDGHIMDSFINPQTPLETAEGVMTVWNWTAQYITSFDISTIPPELKDRSNTGSWIKNFSDEDVAFFCQKFRYRQEPKLRKHHRQRAVADRHLQMLWSGFGECMADFDINVGLLDMKNKAWPTGLKSDHALKDYFRLIVPKLPEPPEDSEPEVINKSKGKSKDKGKEKMLSDDSPVGDAPHSASAATAESEPSSGEKDLPVHPKLKTKTRPDHQLDVANAAILRDELPIGDIFGDFDDHLDDDPADDWDDDEEVIQADPTTAGSISLPQKHLFTMRCIFRAEKQKLIKWTAFKKALAFMNFEVEKQGGSVWRIAPPQAISKHGICIHYHEEATIEPYKRNEFAYRMRHTFGWGATTFVLG